MRRGVFILAMLGVLGASLGFSQSALAGSGCNQYTNGHCYGISWWDSPQNNGTYGHLLDGCLSGPNDSSDFVDTEIWEATDGSSGAYWVESGLSYGEINGVARGGPYLFWADNRPNGGGYNEHYIAAASLETTYTDQMEYIGSNEWQVYLGGYVNTSTSNPPYSHWMSSGIEMTESSFNAVGYATTLEWDSTSQGWLSGWNSSGSWGLVDDSPATAVWTSDYTSLAYYANCGEDRVAASTTTGATPQSASVSGSSGPVALTPQSSPTLVQGTASVSAAELPALGTLAQSMATSAGGSAIGSASAVLTTRQQANLVASGALVDSNQPVYLVQLVGAFTAPSARAPSSDSSVPSGKYLTFVVDASDGSVLDWGVSNQSGALSTLGPVSQLSV